MDLKSKIDRYLDYPIDGVDFKDINSLIRDPEAFRFVIDEFCQVAKALDINKIVIPESRGYIFGCPIAYKLGIGLVPVRKPGKLPGEVIVEEYDLEYGTNKIEMQKNALNVGDRVLIVDDLLATGGTMKAATHLAEQAGAEVCGMLFLIELTDLKGREKLGDYFIKSLVQYKI